MLNCVVYKNGIIFNFFFFGECLKIKYSWYWYLFVDNGIVWERNDEDGN